MVPDMMFKTTNPEYWMRVNDETPEDDQVKVVILSSNKISENTIEYIMGMYYISNITIIDEEGSRLPGYDEELLIRLNQVINENISLGMISHLKRSLSMKQLINTEEFIKNNLADVLLNDESAIEDNDDSNNIEYESVGNDAEDAAVAALMNSSNNSIDVPEEDNTLESELINGKDYSEDEEVETSEEEVVINDNNENVEDVPDNSDYHEYDNEDDNQMMFQPIRRKKRLE